MNYTGADFVQNLSHTLTGSASVNWNPSYSYAPSPQMTGNLASNDAYSYHPSTGGAGAYVANALNQYASVTGTTFAYDGISGDTVPI